eukprot:gene26644-33253_t
MYTNGAVESHYSVEAPFLAKEFLDDASDSEDDDDSDYTP